MSTPTGGGDDNNNQQQTTPSNFVQPKIKDEQKQKLFQKIQQLRSKLTPEGFSLLEQCANKFTEGQITQEQLKQVYDKIKDRYSIQPQQQQNVQQQSTVDNQQQQPTSTSPISQQQQNPQISLSSFTDEERFLLNQFKNIKTQEEKVAFIQQNPNCQIALKKLKMLKNAQQQQGSVSSSSTSGQQQQQQQGSGSGTITSVGGGVRPIQQSSPPLLQQQQQSTGMVQQPQSMLGLLTQPTNFLPQTTGSLGGSMMMMDTTKPSSSSSPPIQQQQGYQSIQQQQQYNEPYSKKQRFKEEEEEEESEEEEDVEMVEPTTTSSLTTYNEPNEDDSVYTTSRYNQHQQQQTAEPSFLNQGPLKNKLIRILKSNNLKQQSVNDNLCEFMSLAVQDRLRSIIEQLITNTKIRIDLDSKLAPDFITITSDSNFQLVQREMKVKQKILQEEEHRREEEERSKEAQKKKQTGGDKRKRATTSREEEEQRMSDMNEAVSMALGGVFGKKASKPNISKKSSSANLTNGSGKGEDQDGSSSVLGKRSTNPNASSSNNTNNLRIVAKDAILYLEQEPQLRKSKLLYSLYLKLKE